MMNEESTTELLSDKTKFLSGTSRTLEEIRNFIDEKFRNKKKVPELLKEFGNS